MPRCGRWPCPSRLAAWRPHPSASCSPVGLGGAKRYPINASVRERWVSLRSTHPTQIRLRVLAALIARGLHLRLSLRNLEGAGKTGCAPHPRSRVPMHTAKAHTSIQVRRKHSGLPCAMALRLTSCSSRRTAFLPPSPALLIARLAPAPRRPNSTTSPYA
jgi:hypothetical protein